MKLLLPTGDMLFSVKTLVKNPPAYLLVAGSNGFRLQIVIEGNSDSCSWMTWKLIADSYCKKLKINRYIHLFSITMLLKINANFNR